MPKLKVDNTKQPKPILRIFNGLMSRVNNYSSDLAYSPVSNPEAEALENEDVRLAAMKDDLRKHLPIILSQTEEDPTIFDKVEDAYDYLKSSDDTDFLRIFGNVDFKRFISDINKEIREYFNNIINQSKGKSSLNNSRNSEETKLADHFCKMLQNPCDESDISSLGFFVESFSTPTHCYRSSEFACGIKDWPPHLRLAWTIFRANILAMQSRNEPINVETIRALAIQIRFRCAELKSGELIKLQWRTCGSYKFEQEPAAAFGSTPQISESYSWSVVLRQEQVYRNRLEDFVVVGAQGHVVARLEQCMGTNSAELQPYLHSPAKANDPDNHSLQIGSDKQEVNGLPAFCGLSYIAFGKSMRCYDKLEAVEVKGNNKKSRANK